MSTLSSQVPGRLCLHLHSSLLHHQPWGEHPSGPVPFRRFLPHHPAACLQDIQPHQEGQSVWQQPLPETLLVAVISLYCHNSICLFPWLFFPGSSICVLLCVLCLLSDPLHLCAASLQRPGGHDAAVCSRQPLHGRTLDSRLRPLQASLDPLTAQCSFSCNVF